MEKLDNICSFLSGNAWSAAKFYDSPPGIPIVRIQNLGDNENEKKIYWRESFDKKYLVNDGDILLSLSGSIKLDEWKGGEALLNQRIVKITPNKKINKSYFIFKLSSLVNEITHSGKHALVNNVSINDVKDLNIPLPDLKTQQKIASILEQADVARQKRKQANQLTEQFLQSAFLEMFGDPVRNEKGWEKRNIKSVCERFSDGPFGSNLKTEHYRDRGVRVIRLNNIGVSNFFDDDKVFISEEHFHTLKKYSCRAGDILIGTMGDPNLRACILPKEISLAINKADCINCKPNQKIILPEFLCYLLNDETFVHSVSNLVLGETRGRISMGRLSKVDIILPPLPLQQKFARVVERVEQLRVKQRESEKVLENLFGSLMQRYFG